MVLCQHILHLFVVGIEQVAIVDARHGVAFVGAVALVVTDFTIEDKVFNGLIGELTVNHDTIAFRLALVVVSAKVNRRTAIQAFQVGELVPVVVACSPIHVAFKGLIVFHILVDAIGIHTAHRVAESAALAVHEVGGELDAHLFAGFVVTLQKHG